MIRKSTRKTIGFLRSSVEVGRTRLARRGLNRRYYKVFAIGFNKTATTSIHTLFRSAGLHASHEIGWRDTDDLTIHYRYRAFSDGPPNDFARLDRHFPRSKFILNTRDLDEWIDSRLEHVRFELGMGVDESRPNWSFSESSVIFWIRRRNDYHLKVLKYFKNRPKDLLIVNFIRDPEAALKIREFLDLLRDRSKPFARPIPKAREAGRLRNRDMIERCFQALGIPETEWQMDLYCPSLVTDRALLRFPPDTDDLT